MLRPALQSNQSSSCNLYRSKDRGAKGLNGQIVSTKRAADGKKQINRVLIDEKREKYRAKNESLRNPSTDSKRMTFLILINHASASIRKEILSSMSKASKEASRNQFVKKGRMPHKVESF